MSIKYNGSDSKYSDLLNSILNLSESYVFLDNIRSFPVTLTKPYLDLGKELRGMDPRLYHEEDEFFMDIVDKFLALNDPHTIFVPPCYSYLHYALPYSFHPEVDPINKSNVIIRLGRTFASNVTTYWHDFVKKPNLLNKVVKAISLTGQKEDLEDARLVLQRFADEFVHYSRFPAGRINRAIQRDFHLRRASRFRFPGECIMIEYANESNRNSTQIEQLNWFGYVLDEPKNITSECPNWNFVRPPQSPVDAYLPPADWDSLVPSSDGTQVLRDEEPFPPDDDWETVQAKIDEEIAGPWGFRPVDWDMINANRSRLLRKEFVDNQEETVFEEETLEEEMDFTVGVHGPRVTYEYNSTTNVSYLQFRSFGFTDNDTISATYRALVSILYDKPKKLILDLRSNSGGKIAYAMEIFQFLFPQSIPLYGIYHFRNSTFTPRMMQDLRGLVTTVQYSPTNATFILRQLIANSIPYTFIENEANTSTFTKNYSLPFRKTFLDSKIIDQALWKAWVDRVEFIGNLFEPENVIVVTDGMCGSVCACLAKKIKADHLGKVVGIGGAPLWLKDGPNDVASWEGWRDEFDVGAFAGGLVTRASLPMVETATGNSSQNPPCARFSLTLLGMYNWGDKPEFYSLLFFIFMLLIE